MVGVVETHGRAETAALLAGLDDPAARSVALPRPHARRVRSRRGAGARSPALILVDELAHTNVAGSRHPKRWQDVEELLDAGIDVWTTLNVQHLESLNDVVARITGVRVARDGARPRLRRRRRSRAGRPAARRTAGAPAGRQGLHARSRPSAPRRNFFRKGNLIALRELALRRTADRVDVDVRSYRRGSSPPPSGRRAMRCWSASAPSARREAGAQRGAARGRWARRGTRSTSRRRRCSACPSAPRARSCAR